VWFRRYLGIRRISSNLKHNLSKEISNLIFVIKKGATRVNTRKIAKAISKGPGIDDERRIIRFSDVFRRVLNKCCRETEEQSFQSVKFCRMGFTSSRKILGGNRLKETVNVKSSKSLDGFLRVNPG
jgi:hypothetical protein